MRFPYTPYAVQALTPSGFTLAYRPMVRVRVTGPTGDYPVLARVDTGADDTVLSNAIPSSVGLGPAHLSSPLVIGGIGGLVAVRFATIDMDIDDGQTVFRWSATVGFYDTNPSPGPPVLGVKGFLEFFTATFNGRRRRLDLVPNGLAPLPVFPAP